ncbi:MAG: DUF721 domain-containing protein [Alphaproteobacteria bacterium]|nr:DUF721 domain-containing protein [Alphaproteobacteria bacterium]
MTQLRAKDRFSSRRLRNAAGRPVPATRPARPVAPTAGAALKSVARTLLKRRGMASLDLVAQWPAIVGAELARLTLPEALKGAGTRGDATLVLRVASAGAPLVQHMAPQIIERVNGALGGRIVARLKLVHGALGPRPQGSRPL